MHNCIGYSITPGVYFFNSEVLQTSCSDFKRCTYTVRVDINLIIFREMQNIRGLLCGFYDSFVKPQVISNLIFDLGLH